MTIFSGELHAFDTKLATLYGLEESIILHHFLHWIALNKRKGHNKREGRYWTYQTQEDILAHFPYFKNKCKVRRILESLVKRNILVKGNFNKLNLDRTVWYAFYDEHLFLDEPKQNSPQKPPYVKSDTCISQIRHMDKSDMTYAEVISDTPIPDNKPKTDNKREERESVRARTEAEASSPPQKIDPFELHGKFVRLKKAELEELKANHGDKVVEECIDKINDFLASTGKKPYKDYAATIRIWIKRDAEKATAPKFTNFNSKVDRRARDKDGNVVENEYKDLF